MNGYDAEAVTRLCATGEAVWVGGSSSTASEESGATLVQLRFVRRGTARAWLVKNGYDEAFGARPLRRLIQKEVENELARRVLANEFAEGDAVRVDVVDDRLAFERLTRATASPEPAIVPEVSQTA